jgi:hypothetical protein
MEGLSMRPWMIVLSSAFGALAVAIAVAVPEMLNAPHAEVGPKLLPLLPALAVAALAVYALCAMLLTTATLVAGILRMRQYLARAGTSGGPPQRNWPADFAASGFEQLAPRLAPALAQSARADGRVMLHTRFNASEARREIMRLHYISLARSHFFSALIVMAGIVGLGVAQDCGALPLLSGTIPTASATLILVGSVLLAGLGRIAIDVTAEPLLETISQLPAERVEVGLLRRAVELLEIACNMPAADDSRTPSAPAELPERLVAVVERDHQALLDAVNRLTANTQALETAMQSSVETLETVVRTAAAQSPPIDEEKVAYANAFPELRAAIEELTTVLQRLSASPEGAEEPAFAAEPEPVRRRRIPGPRIARELQRLLQEIEAAR